MAGYASLRPTLLTPDRAHEAVGSKDVTDTPSETPATPVFNPLRRRTSGSSRASENLRHHDRIWPFCISKVRVTAGSDRNVCACKTAMACGPASVVHKVGWNRVHCSG